MQEFREKCDALILEKSDDYSNPPRDLSIEFISNPAHVSIKDPRPEFSWIVPKESVFQSCYQVLVSSSQSLIDNNNGDVWDSGHVQSSTSSDIKYEGISLEEGKVTFGRFVFGMM